MGVGVTCVRLSLLFASLLSLSYRRLPSFPTHTSLEIATGHGPLLRPPRRAGRHLRRLPRRHGRRHGRGPHAVRALVLAGGHPRRRSPGPLRRGRPPLLVDAQAVHPAHGRAAHQAALPHPRARGPPRPGHGGGDRRLHGPGAEGGRGHLPLRRRGRRARPLHLAGVLGARPPAPAAADGGGPGLFDGARHGRL